MTCQNNRQHEGRKLGKKNTSEMGGVLCEVVAISCWKLQWDGDEGCVTRKGSNHPIYYNIYQKRIRNSQMKIRLTSES